MPFDVWYRGSDRRAAHAAHHVGCAAATRAELSVRAQPKAKRRRRCAESTSKLCGATPGSYELYWQDGHARPSDRLWLVRCREFCKRLLSVENGNGCCTWNFSDTQRARCRNQVSG